VIRMKTVITKRPMKWGTLDVPRGEEITLSDPMADGMIARGMATAKPKPEKKAKNAEVENAG